MRDQFGLTRIGEQCTADQFPANFL